jgi:RNA polymerase sigma-70 factor (ECF subfamily)
MLGPDDAMMEQALEQGRKNEETIVLIKKHCAHARVEYSQHMGHSMLEDMTGLPISGREMRCEYGRQPTSVALDLMRNALAYYEENCIGCAHRQVQAVPNLKTAAEKAIEARRRDEEGQTRASAATRTAQATRAQQRAALIASEPPGTRAMIALLDGVDVDEPDERADELVDLCRLHPELCTQRAARILLDATAEIHDDRLFAALLHLDAARRLDREALLAAGVGALARRPLRQAARIVVELNAGLAAGQLIRALPSIVQLAAPPHNVGMAPLAEVAPLQLAAATELPALLDLLREWLAHEDKYPRRTAAAAARLLIEHEPAVAPVLVGPMIDALALPGSLDRYMGDPGGDLVGALCAALIADPGRTSEVIERRGAVAPAPVRDTLFHAFDAVIRDGGHDRDAPRPAADVAVDMAFRRTSGDWGNDIVRAAADLIELASTWEPALMGERVDELFGALLTLISAPTPPPLTLDLPPGMPPFMRSLQVQNDEMMRSGAIHLLREALGNLVSVAPEAVARNVFTVIEAPDLDTDEAKDLRDEAVRLLGDLGRRADLLPDVLPALWTALVHADQRVRASGIVAWQEIATVAHRRLPPDLGELLPALLADRYVIVHKEAARALRRGVPVPEQSREQVVPMLLTLAEHYRTDDTRLLDDILHVVWGQSRHFAAPLTTALRERCLQLVAVELMAETFACVVADRRSFRGTGDEAAIAWLYAIARHRLASWLRHARVERRALSRLGLEPPQLSDAELERIDELAGTAELRVRIAGELDALAPDQRDALQLRIVEECSYEDVAARLGVSEQTARARVSRGLRALGDAVAEAARA